MHEAQAAAQASDDPASTELETIGENGTDLHGKITKCATAGSFDDTEAVKQTRYLKLLVLWWEVMKRME